MQFLQAPSMTNSQNFQKDVKCAVASVLKANKKVLFKVFLFLQHKF